MEKDSTTIQTNVPGTTTTIASRSETQSDPPESEYKLGVWTRFLSSAGWYPRDMPAVEKSLVLRLDVMILIFGCLSFFTKYLDQAAITNAYVSGMKEDLHLHGNELNYITVVFWASYCTLMIPACYYLTRTRINVALPALELVWGLFTFGCAWATNVETIYAMRFFIGAAETCSFTGIIYVIGSWYKPQEVARRIALFFIASPLGTMFAGYLQAAAYNNLDQVNGLAGWRWLFIICTIITLPVCILGFLIFPDVPHRRKPYLLTQTQHSLANKRLVGLTAPAELRISRSIFKRVFGRWHWYVFVLQWTLLDQNAIAGGQPFSLYLKAKSSIYSVTDINTLPTIGTAISVVTALAAGLYADYTASFWLPSVLAIIPVMLGSILLAVWNIGENGRLAAFIITGTAGVLSPMTMGWATTLMASDAEERAIVTASMNAIGQAISAWSQLLEYPTVEAPNFHKGFVVTACMAGVQILGVGLIWVLARRETGRKGRGKEEKEGEGGGVVVV